MFVCVCVPVKQASESSAKAESKAIRSSLIKLKKLLNNSERNQDYFALLDGVPTVMAVYSEDNQLVLTIVLEACRVTLKLRTPHRPATSSETSVPTCFARLPLA